LICSLGGQFQNESFLWFVTSCYVITLRSYFTIIYSTNLQSFFILKLSTKCPSQATMPRQPKSTFPEDRTEILRWCVLQQAIAKAARLERRLKLTQMRLRKEEFLSARLANTCATRFDHIRFLNDALDRVTGDRDAYRNLAHEAITENPDGIRRLELRSRAIEIELPAQEIIDLLSDSE